MGEKRELVLLVTAAREFDDVMASAAWCDVCSDRQGAALEETAPPGARERAGERVGGSSAWRLRQREASARPARAVRTKESLHPLLDTLGNLGTEEEEKGLSNPGHSMILR